MLRQDVFSRIRGYGLSNIDTSYGDLVSVPEPKVQAKCYSVKCAGRKDSGVVKKGLANHAQPCRDCGCDLVWGRIKRPW